MNTKRKFFRAVIIPCLVAWFSQSAIAQKGDSPFTFNITGSLNTGRLNHTATLLSNGKILVAGGSSGVTNGLASAELYDPAVGTWVVTGSLNTGRYGHAATLLPNGKVLVAGGFDSNFNALASAELYDPASGTWASTGSLNTARARLTATLLPNGKVLVAGGSNATSLGLASAELYDPASGSWTANWQPQYRTCFTDGDVAARWQGPRCGGF